VRKEKVFLQKDVGDIREQFGSAALLKVSSPTTPGLKHFIKS